MRTRICFMAAAVLAGVLLCSFGVSAEEQYQTEVSATYNRFDADLGSRVITYGVSGQVFFAPVPTAEHPYAEAAFLERIGSVILTAEKEESKSGSGFVKGDGPVYMADLTFAKPGMPIAAEILYSRLRLDFDTPLEGFYVAKESVGGLRVGNYFTNTLFAGVQYMYRTIQISFMGNPSSALRGNDYGLFAKYVREIGHQELSLEAELGQRTESEEADRLRNTEFSIAADYFFTKGLSAGVGFKNSSGTAELEEGKTYSANVRYFITPRLSVQALYNRFLNSHPLIAFSDQTLESTRQFGFVVAGRF